MQIVKIALVISVMLLSLNAYIANRRIDLLGEKDEEHDRRISLCADNVLSVQDRLQIEIQEVRQELFSIQVIMGLDAKE